MVGAEMSVVEELDSWSPATEPSGDGRPLETFRKADCVVVACEVVVELYERCRI